MKPGEFSIGILAGQRLMAGFDGTGMNRDLRFLIGELKVGGIILFSRNVSNPEQIKALCGEAQALARAKRLPPLFVAIDQEGGPVARLGKPFTLFPGNPAMKGEGDAEQFAATTAAELKSVGINMNLAPVMDVPHPDVDSIMTTRAFGSDPDRVSRMGATVIRHLQQNGIMAVAKHFPGIGRTTLDSHLTQPVLDTSRGDLAAWDLPPFKAAISGQVAAIMLSHILYRGLDEQWPAGLSTRIALDLLRDRLGYRGVTMTDDLDMKSIKGRYGLSTVIRRILAARIDMALVCHKGPDIEAAVEHLRNGIGESTESRENARASVERIMALKSRFRLAERIG